MAFKSFASLDIGVAFTYRGHELIKMPEITIDGRKINAYEPPEPGASDDTVVFSTHVDEACLVNTNTTMDPAIREKLFRAWQEITETC